MDLMAYKWIFTERAARGIYFLRGVARGDYIYIFTLREKCRKLQIKSAVVRRFLHVEKILINYECFHS